MWEHGGVRGLICTWKVNEGSFCYSWSQITSAFLLPQRRQKFCCRRKVPDLSSPWDGKDSLLVISSRSSPAKGRAERVTLQAAVQFVHLYTWTGAKFCFAGGYRGWFDQYESKHLCMGAQWVAEIPLLKQVSLRWKMLIKSNSNWMGIFFPLKDILISTAEGYKSHLHKSQPVKSPASSSLLILV